MHGQDTVVSFRRVNYRRAGQPCLPPLTTQASPLTMPVLGKSLVFYVNYIQIYWVLHTCKAYLTFI